MPYIGNKSDTAFTSLIKQDLTGASGTSFVLSHAVANANDIALYINNVRQEPVSAYSTNGTAVSLTGSVVSSDDIYVIYLARAVQTTVTPDGSVSTAKLANSAVNLTSKVTGVLPVANGGTGVSSASSLTYLSAKLVDNSGGYSISSGNIITPFVVDGNSNGVTMSSQNRFTVSSAGVYVIKSRFYIYGNANPATTFYLIKRNGSEIARVVNDMAGFSGSNGDYTRLLEWSGELSASDYIEFFNDTSSLTSFANSNHHNRISIIKLGTL